ncbi:MAG TPA: tetratricopeptide repeat protein, partial [Myxococcota bacterium]|nr:tetratricopeptide repeat protein [Myxococcota bacterium]
MRARLLRAFAASLALVASAALGDANAGARSGAIAQLEAALRARPNDAALARALARAQLEAGLTDAALATLDAQSARAPQQRAALAQLRGRALYARGDLALARSALQDAIAY